MREENVIGIQYLWVVHQLIYLLLKDLLSAEGFLSEEDNSV